MIIAAGTRANTELLEQTDLKRDQYGLLINEYSQTSDRSVYGAGDITGKNMVWPSAAKEAMTAAYHMTGTKFPMTDFFKGKATIHTFNIPTMAYGLPKAPDDSYTVEIKEKENGSYQKVIHKEGKIFGMILQGDLYFAGILNQLISTKADIRKLDKPVLELEYGDLIGSSREVGHI